MKSARHQAILDLIEQHPIDRQEDLLAHLRGNPLFLVIMVAIGLIQVALLYYGGALFRTVPLEPSSFVLVLAGAFSVIPADLLRKYAQSLLRQGLAPR